MIVHLELNEKQAQTMIEALHLFAWIGMGQLQYIEDHSAFLKRDYDRQKIFQLLDQVKHTVFSDLHGRGHSYGIRHEQTGESSKEAFDMYQVLRHALAWHRNPEGHTWSIVFDKPIPYSKQPLMTCKVEEKE